MKTKSRRDGKLLIAISLLRSNLRVSDSLSLIMYELPLHWGNHEMIYVVRWCDCNICLWIIWWVEWCCYGNVINIWRGPQWFTFPQGILESFEKGPQTPLLFSNIFHWNYYVSKTWLFVNYWGKLFCKRAVLYLGAPDMMWIIKCFQSSYIRGQTCSLMITSTRRESQL